MQLYTIGFTKKSAQRFFTILADAGVRRIIDIRLHRTSQLAGFAKYPDLQFFLARLCNMEYTYCPDLAPTEQLLKSYRSKSMDWNTYTHDFNKVLRSRSVENTIDARLLDQACLLCAEPDPAHCHRSIVAQYLCDRYKGIVVCHL